MNPTETNDADRPLRIGVLGASRIAELAINEASQETGEIRAAVAARDPERAAAYAAEHGYERAHADYASLVADDSLDLVYIALPNALHALWTARALEAGRSVLVEKPFAANHEELGRVVARLDSSSGWVWEAFHYADHPVMRRMLQLVDSGEIGELRSVSVAMVMPAPPGSDPRWSFDLAGGATMDVGCYALHALGLIGERLGAAPRVLSASAVGHRTDPRVDAELRARLALGDVPAEIVTGMVGDRWDFRLHLEGSRGSATAPSFAMPSKDDRVLLTLDGRVVEERLGLTPSYAYQLRRIRGLVRSGARHVDELHRSQRTAELIDASYLAAGLPVRPGRLDS